MAKMQSRNARAQLGCPAGPVGLFVFNSVVVVARTKSGFHKKKYTSQYKVCNSILYWEYYYTLPNFFMYRNYYYTLCRKYSFF